MSGRQAGFGAKVLLVAALVLGSGGVASALPSLIFDQVVDGGSVGIATGLLTGTDIKFEFVTGFDTPDMPGVTLYCNGSCLLDFVTGILSSAEIGVGDVHTDTYTFSGGGSYVLSGELWTGVGGTGTLIAMGTLVDGTWLDGVTASVTVAFDTAVSLVVGGSGLDTKHPDLASFYGLGPDFIFANTNISSDIEDYTPGTEALLDAKVVEADLGNFPVPAVPEPGTLLLLGAGLAALGVRGLRAKA